MYFIMSVVVAVINIGDITLRPIPNIEWLEVMFFPPVSYSLHSFIEASICSMTFCLPLFLRPLYLEKFFIIAHSFHPQLLQPHNLLMLLLVLLLHVTSHHSNTRKYSLTKECQNIGL